MRQKPVLRDECTCAARVSHIGGWVVQASEASVPAPLLHCFLAHFLSMHTRTEGCMAQRSPTTGAPLNAISPAALAAAFTSASASAMRTADRRLGMWKVTAPFMITDTHDTALHLMWENSLSDMAIIVWRWGFTDLSALSEP